MCLTNGQCDTLRLPIKEAMDRRGLSESVVKKYIHSSDMSVVHKSIHRSSPVVANSTHVGGPSQLLASSPFLSRTDGCPSIQSLMRCIDFPPDQERACLLTRSQFIACRSKTSTNDDTSADGKRSRTRDKQKRIHQDCK